MWALPELDLEVIDFRAASKLFAAVRLFKHGDYAQRGAPVRVALYDDRLTVESPGLLPFGLIVDDLRQGISRLRNRVIGRVFHQLGLIEQWGSSIQRMTAACLDAGLAAPELEEVGLRFRVTLRRGQVAVPKGDALDQAILDTSWRMMPDMPRPKLPATLAARLAPPARAWWPSSSAAWSRKSVLARATRNAAIIG